jgi:peptide/nickel transport system ATP-binding protein
LSFLEISDLKLKAGQKTILDGVSLSVEKGQVVGLIGESGAGKSTLALAAMGFLKPGLEVTGGSVVLDGTDLMQVPDQQLRKLRRNKVAYVAQSAAASFNPFYRLGDQVMELATLETDISKGERRKMAADLFRRLRLAEPETFARKYPHQVSGGQLQRAMIAMALLNDPELIVFDEPTTALDVTTQVEVLRVIRLVIAEHACAAIYVSHDLAVVSQMCDDILVLRHGKTVERSAPRALIDMPKTEYARDLVAHRATGDFPSDELADKPLVLEATSLKLGYRKHLVVPSASVSVRAGEVIALVGESGSGKTTLARAIAGLLKPWEGKVTLFGDELAGDVDNRTQEQRRRVQFVHQLPDVALNPRHSIRVTLARPLRMFHGISGSRLESRLAQLMDEVELPHELLARTPGALSGGQKQRICIARCLAAEPDILICDEVTSALDPLIEDSILKLLWRLQQEHSLGIFFITHNLGVTRRFAHSVVIMESGMIVERGPTAEIFSDPQQAYTKRLLAAEPSTRSGWLEEQLEPEN